MVGELARRRIARCAPGVAGILLLAGCGSGASGSAGSSAATTAPTAAVSAGAAAVSATTGPLGVYLVDGAGRTLYLFDSDSAGTSSCVDACAKNWPPLTTAGAPVAAAGAAADKLSTATRPDGSMQVRYAGHPLYYFAGDQETGQTNGAGSDGKWWIVGPDGGPIKSGDDQGDDSGGLPGGGY